MKQQNILILGGNGKTGRRVAEKLKQRGQHAVRIASRSTHPAFDWEKSSTWKDAVEGMDAVYIAFQPDLAVPGAPQVIREFTTLAKQQGVKKMVLLSGRGETEAQVCEDIVKATAPGWTIVRASWFNQNFSESIFLDPVLAGHVALPRAETPEPFIDADDIADVVVESLLDDKHHGHTYEVTGPRLLTFPQVVEEIARATGRSIVFQPITLDEYAAMLRAYKVPEDFIWLVHYLFAEVLDGRNASVTNDVEQVLGRKPKDFSEYAREVAASGVWKDRTGITGD